MLFDKLNASFQGKWRQQRLMEIEMTKRKGIFAPLTSNGRILVNDILASCYSDVKEATLQTTFFGVRFSSFYSQKLLF